MKAHIAFILAILIYHTSAYAEYYLYFMNNTYGEITLRNTCDHRLDSPYCRALNTGKLDAFKRVESHSINYDSGIDEGEDYTLKSFFSIPGSENTADNNYFSTTFHGDFWGSHITEVSVYVDGIQHVLLNKSSDNKSSGNKSSGNKSSGNKSSGNKSSGNKSSGNEVLPDEVGSVAIRHSDGNTYTFYVNAQKDMASIQTIDHLFYAIDKKPTLLSSESDNELTVITYNIKAFPDYIGLVLDLNKVDSRVRYLSQADALRKADVLVFQEAWDSYSRDTLKKKLHDIYPHSYDPIPESYHLRPLGSGLLALSRYPITNTTFVNYQDYQDLQGDDDYSNKGAAYFKIDKNGKAYNLITTHAQAGGGNNSIAARREEFRIIKREIIDSKALAIPNHEPLLVLGDFNTDFYDKKQFGHLQSILNLNSENVLNNLFKTPKFSADSDLNLMIAPEDRSHSILDMVLPVKDFLQPVSSLSQITPLRALDDNRMYQRSYNAKLYHYGNVELSDHFMVQAKFTFAE
ncbi:endonuclease/exonuclease/phosphatase family protein [Endozoicomonas gorgoniicola]|uniref:Endonuclease/exonuclease/phosphatase family protein n=1 Tax=Endozoicomonas gorgoniicola TaxID=1234144 RepID=A0ABT3N067_9GAMM|nr:endonuclease/exonuclease/phosphatase family protein [Endozoicomonas gorgoniicola]MCW7554639.1 endonuclease/exonuclease/phosphatase family protein [Endozoicomonas gorgoniicola]